MIKFFGYTVSSNAFRVGKCLAVALMMASYLFPVGSVSAAQTVFAYVDVPRAMASSDAAKQARNILQKALENKQKEVNSMEANIKKMKEDLERRKNLMTPESSSELAGEIRRKFREYQRLVEDNQASIDRENGQWTKKITEALRQVIEEVGRNDGYTIIFGKGQVLYASSSIDITDQVLKKLNANTKKWF